MTSPLRVAKIATICSVLSLIPIPSAAGDGKGGLKIEIREAIDQIMAQTVLGKARTSIAVASLDSGHLLYAYDADALLNPASNVKLFTSAAVLAKLGPEYRFETEIQTDARPSRGTVKSLYVKGKGDPTMVTERLWALAGDIARRGVKVVRGDIVVDDGFFDAEREGPGYDQERGDRSYLAPIGALSLNFNVVAIHVAPGEKVGEPGRVSLEPWSEHFQLENRTRTVKARAFRRISPSSSRLASGKQRITVNARIPLGVRDMTFYRKIDDPPVYFGSTLRKLLELRGVKINGRVRRGTVPADASPLTVAKSDSLAEIVRKLEKTSNNFVAEQLLKTLGAEKSGPPGTWSKGLAVVEDYLAEIGIPRGAYVMKNGSGLNDTNRFSARQTITLLREIWQHFPVMADFVAALPVAGKDGTTRSRMGGTEGRVRAKTGTLEGVTSLSGYAETASHERLVFSIIVNDFSGRALPVIRAVDAIGNALAAAGGKPADLGVAVASARPPTPKIDPNESKTRAQLATYYQLGRAGGDRNTALLKTALRTERDPVLRLAAAEAIYMGEPDSEASRRLFLDSVAADQAGFDRLRQLGPPADAFTPIVRSLAELASEGDKDALARLVEVTPASVSDPASRDRMAEIWEEVAGNAPDDVVRALKSATTQTVDVALASMALGIVSGQEKDHPLPATVRRIASGSDPVLSAFAKALSPRLEAQMAAARTSRQTGPPATIGPVTSPAPAPAR